MTAGRPGTPIGRRLRYAIDAFKLGTPPEPPQPPEPLPIGQSLETPAAPEIKPPFPRAPRGSRPSTRFFDDYPRFFETSTTSPRPWRLNLRYDAIFDENRHVFEGAQVLDIASHDGRWSLAALRTGAASVVGIEARPELVRNAGDNLAHYGCDPATYRFITGDVFEVLANEAIKVDVVLCLGFLYHTLRYNELFQRMAECRPKWLLLDTEVLPGELEPLVRVRAEGVGKQNNAVADQLSRGHRVLSGRPSREAVKVMARAYGFEVNHRSDWGSLLRDNPGAEGVRDYAERRRVTLRATRVRRPRKPG